MAAGIANGVRSTPRSPASNTTAVQVTDANASIATCALINTGIPVNACRIPALKRPPTVSLTTRFCTFWIPLNCGILYALRYSMNPQASDRRGVELFLRCNVTPKSEEALTPQPNSHRHSTDTIH